MNLKFLENDISNFRAEVAAVRNGGINKVPGKVCAIFAKSSTNWRQNVIKVRSIFSVTAHAPLTYTCLSH